MKLFIDENLSPHMALELCGEGHVAVHPRNNGGLGMADRAIVRRAIDADLVIVTTKVRDFTRLLASEDIHPGLIAVPDGSRDEVEFMLQTAINWLYGRGDPMDLMVNKMLIVLKNGKMDLRPLPQMPDGS